MTRSIPKGEKRAEAPFGMSQCLFFTTLIHDHAGNPLFHAYSAINQVMPTPTDRKHLPCVSIPRRAPPIDANKGNFWSTG
jgi:hypothetical protein